MIKIVISLALVASVFADKGYYHKHKEEECHYNGQLIVSGHHSCSYIECGYGAEPWEVEGEIPLQRLTRQCAPGTAVNPHFSYDKYAEYAQNPCSVVSEHCGKHYAYPKHPKHPKHQPVYHKHQPSYGYHGHKHQEAYPAKHHEAYPAKHEAYPTKYETYPNRY